MTVSKSMFPASFICTTEVCLLASGDTELQGTVTIAGQIVRNTVSFILDPSDNLAAYQCRASNDATSEPLVAEVTLHVNCK